MKTYSDVLIAKYFVSLVAGISGYADGDFIGLLKVCNEHAAGRNR